MTSAGRAPQRALIEFVVDALEHTCPIGHTRHRRPLNFLVTLMAGLIAYCHLPKKPSLELGLPALPAATRLILNSRYTNTRWVAAAVNCRRTGREPG